MDDVPDETDEAPPRADEDGDAQGRAQAMQVENVAAVEHEVHAPERYPRAWLRAGSAPTVLLMGVDREFLHAMGVASIIGGIVFLAIAHIWPGS